MARTTGIFTHETIGKDIKGTGVEIRNAILSGIKPELNFKDLIVGRISPLNWGDYDKPILVSYDTYRDNFISLLGNDLERKKELRAYFHNTGEDEENNDNKLGYVLYGRVKGTGGSKTQYKVGNPNDTDIGTITAKYDGVFGNDITVNFFQDVIDGTTYLRMRVTANDTTVNPNATVLIEELSKMNIDSAGINYYYDFINNNSKYVSVSNKPNTYKFTATNNATYSVDVPGNNPTVNKDGYAPVVDVFKETADKDMISLTIANTSESNSLSGQDLKDIQLAILDKIDNSDEIKERSIIPLFNPPVSGVSVDELTDNTQGKLRYDLGNYFYNYISNNVEYDGTLSLDSEVLSGDVDSALVFLGAYRRMIEQYGYKALPIVEYNNGYLKGVRLKNEFTIEEKGKIGNVGYIVLITNNYGQVSVGEIRTPIVFDTEDDKAYIYYTTLIAKSTFDVRTRKILSDLILTNVDNLPSLRDKIIAKIRTANSSLLSNNDVIPDFSEEGTVLEQVDDNDGEYLIKIKYDVHRLLENIIVETVYNRNT